MDVDRCAVRLGGRRGIKPALAGRDGTELALTRVRDSQRRGSRRRATISWRFVTRRYPEPDSTEVPSNELAYVEFSRPDLPWMFTPASATPEHRLRPWIVLVVVPLAAQLASDRGGLKIPVAELPDLRQSNAWAHAQIMAETPEDIGPAVVRGGAGAVSRLVCPRRLQEGISYRACVVPAFDATLAPRWSVDAGGAASFQLRLRDVSGGEGRLLEELACACTRLNRWPRWARGRSARSGRGRHGRRFGHWPAHPTIRPQRSSSRMDRWRHLDRARVRRSTKHAPRRFVRAWRST